MKLFTPLFLFILSAFAFAQGRIGATGPGCSSGPNDGGTWTPPALTFHGTLRGDESLLVERPFHYIGEMTVPARPGAEVDHPYLQFRLMHRHKMGVGFQNLSPVASPPGVEREGCWTAHGGVSLVLWLENVTTGRMMCIGSTGEPVVHWPGMLPGESFYYETPLEIQYTRRMDMLMYPYWDHWFPFQPGDTWRVWTTLSPQLNSTGLWPRDAEHPFDIAWDATFSVTLSWPRQDH